MNGFFVFVLLFWVPRVINNFVMGSSQEYGFRSFFLFSLSGCCNKVDPSSSFICQFHVLYMHFSNGHAIMIN